MANHSKHGRPFTLSLPNRSQCVKIVATFAAVGLLATGGIISRSFYTSSTQAAETISCGTVPKMAPLLDILELFMPFLES